MSETRVTVSKKALIIFLVVLGLVIVFLFAHSGAKETYHTCTQAKAAGHGNIKKGDPLYDVSLDRDHDDVACEL